MIITGGGGLDGVGEGTGVGGGGGGGIGVEGGDGGGQELHTDLPAFRRTENQTARNSQNFLYNIYVHVKKRIERMRAERRHELQRLRSCTAKQKMS